MASEFKPRSPLMVYGYKALSEDDASDPAAGWGVDELDNRRRARAYSGDPNAIPDLLLLMRFAVATIEDVARSPGPLRRP